MKKMKLRLAVALLSTCTSVFSYSVLASTCKELPTAKELKTALMSVSKVNDAAANGGVGAPEWLTLLDSSGMVCAVVHNLPADVDVTTQLALNHRILAIQKAGVSNGFSREGLAVSSGNIYVGTQEGEVASGTDSFLNFEINPYGGDPKTYGTTKDPLIGKRLGGNAAVPGGLALFDKNHTKVGAIGASGDFRCSDHVIAWKVREILSGGAYSVANVPYGLSSAHNDALMQDFGADGKSKSGFGYHTCMNNPTDANDGGSIEGN